MRQDETDKLIEQKDYDGIVALMETAIAGKNFSDVFSIVLPLALRFSGTEYPSRDLADDAEKKELLRVMGCAYTALLNVSPEGLTPSDVRSLADSFNGVEQELKDIGFSLPDDDRKNFLLKFSSFPVALERIVRTVDGGVGIVADMPGKDPLAAILTVVRDRQLDDVFMGEAIPALRRIFDRAGTSESAKVAIANWVWNGIEQDIGIAPGGQSPIGLDAAFNLVASAVKSPTALAFLGQEGQTEVPVSVLAGFMSQYRQP